MTEDRAPKTRTYRSKSGAVFEEPIDSQNTSGRWVKVKNQNKFELEQARYVSSENARKIFSKLGTGQRAIDYVFDSAKIRDYKEFGGVVLYTLPNRSRLEPSSEIVEIFPHLEKTPQIIRDSLEDEILQELNGDDSTLLPISRPEHLATDDKKSKPQKEIPQSPIQPNRPYRRG